MGHEALGEDSLWRLDREREGLLRTCLPLPEVPRGMGDKGGVMTENFCVASNTVLFSGVALDEGRAILSSGGLVLRLVIWVCDEQSRLLLATGVAGTSQEESVVLSSLRLLSRLQISQEARVLPTAP